MANEKLSKTKKGRQGEGGGRPQLYSNPETMALKIAEYFGSTDKPTVTGLNYHLDMSKDSFAEYQKKPKFSELLRRAKLFIESKYEERAAYDNSGSNLKFTLINHFGWKDESKLDHTSSDGTMTPQISFYIPDNGRGGE